MTGEPCTCNCGRAQDRDARRGWHSSCYSRWFKAGKPETGPPPARSPQELAAITRQAKADQAALRAAENAPYEPDATDIEFARQRRAERWQRADERLYRAARFAADMSRCVQSGDRYGWRTLWARMDDPWAVMTAFALCADPDLLMAGPDEPERSERSA